MSNVFALPFSAIGEVHVGVSFVIHPVYTAPA